MRMVGRESWKKVMRVRDGLMDEEGLMPNGIPKGVGSFGEYVNMIEEMHKGKGEE